MNSETNQIYMTIPLGDIAHDRACKFAQLQDEPDKAVRVYRNTLTVYAAYCYLQILQIKSDLEQSEGWNLGLAFLDDVASIHLPKFGDLECRLVHPDAKSIDLLATAKEDKIGLLVFRANDTDVTQIEEMEVIGFVTDLSQLPIEIAQLPLTEALLDRLESIQQIFASVLIYVPDLSLAQIKAELEKIYQESDDLRFEYNIGKFLKAGRERSKTRVTNSLEKELESIEREKQEPALARERKDNPDRELHALAAKLAEQLQDLWGRLD
jgi:Protein of unknown function (DUF1822)